MTRKILSGVLAVVAVGAIGFLPTSCQSGGVGDPCTPEDEYTPSFSGFKVTEDNIESRSFQCQTRICLVNHFQGRVSCPLGQGVPTPCNASTPCTNGGTCKLAGSFAPFCAIKCSIDADCAAGLHCKSGKCDDGTATNNFGCPAGFTCQDVGHFCGCSADKDCPGNAPQATGTKYSCTNQDGSPLSGAVGQCTESVCHTDGNCQVAGTDKKTQAANMGKDCCVPGGGPNGDIPIATAVCGQCASTGGRDAANSVYCSCKCGEPFDAKGNELPHNPNFNYCSCPDGFECKEIRKNVGIGDVLLAGQYCIKTKTAFTSADQCGAVVGHFGAGMNGDVSCQGTPTSLGGG